MAITDTLIALSDFADIKEVSTNINDARILPYVREAQRIDITKFLGEALYYQFLNDHTTGEWTLTNFANLYNGATYESGGETVYCHGLKLVLLHFSLARFYKNQDITITSYGIRVLSEGDLSERELLTQIRTKSREAISIAIVYQNECDRFIRKNISEFALYRKSASEAKVMSFKMFKVT